VKVEGLDGANHWEPVDLQGEREHFVLIDFDV
jgi:hypothetical protein